MAGFRRWIPSIGKEIYTEAIDSVYDSMALVAFKQRLLLTF